MITDPPDRCGRRALVYELLGDAVTPVQAFRTLSSNSDAAILFESSEHDSKLARFSIIAVDPLEVIRIKNGQASVDRRDGPGMRVQSIGDTFAFLEERQAVNLHHLSLDGIPEYLPFTCGLAGYIGYDAGRTAAPVSNAASAKAPESNAKAASNATAALNAARLSNAATPLNATTVSDACGISNATASALSKVSTQLDPLDVPDVLMGFFDSAVIFDHLQRRIFIVTFRSQSFAAQLRSALESPLPLTSLSFSAAPTLPVDDCFVGVQCAVERSDFLHAVARCKQYIAEGQAFQLVLAQRFFASVQADALDIYRMLQSVNPSPYAYYLKFPELCYLGSSPETLVQCKNGRVSLRALAGTRRRGSTAELDEQIERDLRCDEKELAEHHMLVDLGRNDLGRIAVPGSVQTGEIASVVRYSHVMHLSTEIRANLADGLNSFDVLAACFPAGTVSGAPKIRAMQLISMVEPEQRGVYAGMVGYINSNGDTDGAIAIRSALVKDGVAHVNAGAGIVFDSVAESEYEETRSKTASVFRALKLAEMREVATSCP